MSKTEELLGRKSSGSSLENGEYGRGDPLCLPCYTLYQRKLALTLPASGGYSVHFAYGLRPLSSSCLFCFEKIYLHMQRLLLIKKLC
jgi:hypothetical protein